MNRLILSCLLSGLGTITTANATNLVAFDIDVRVTSTSAPFPAGISVDDVFTARLQYDTDLAGPFGSFSTDGVGLNDNFITADFGSGSIFTITDFPEADNPGSFSVSVSNGSNFGGGGVDRVSFIANGQTTPFIFGDGMGGPAPFEFSTVILELTDSTATALSSESLPTSLTLSDFDTAVFRFNTGFVGGVGFDGIVGDILSITPVPEPLSAGLCFVAIVCGSGARKKRQLSIG